MAGNSDPRPFAWVDIDNPPQVQYLVPFRTALLELGADVEVTARDYGAALELLRQRDVDHRVFGRHAGSGRVRKGVTVLRRTGSLSRHFARRRPEVVVSASRSAALTAAALRFRSMVIIDYEHVEMRVFRGRHSTIAFPDVIDPEAFRAQGFRDDQLLPFPGIKEDLTFAYTDIESVAPAQFDIEPGLIRVLMRPPAEESHYYLSSSAQISEAMLRRLAARDDVQLIYSPRYPWQARHLEAHSWTRPPLVLDRPVPFLSLLKSVDVVISAGGTMLREAAYLGVPAYSLFQSEMGAVDKHLSDQGRLTLVSSADDLDRVRLEPHGAGITSKPDPGIVRGLARSALGGAAS